jgi:hypothetical protein
MGVSRRRSVNIRAPVVRLTDMMAKSWTAGRGEGQVVRIVIRPTTRGFVSGFTGEIQDATTGEYIGSGQQYRDAVTARSNTRELVQTWWPKAKIVR